jgi:hypothetical protein
MGLMQPYVPERADPLERVAKALSIAQAGYGIYTAHEQGRLRDEQIKQEKEKNLEAEELHTAYSTGIFSPRLVDKLPRVLPGDPNFKYAVEGEMRVPATDEYGNVLKNPDGTRKSGGTKPFFYIPPGTSEMLMTQAKLGLTASQAKAADAKAMEEDIKQRGFITKDTLRKDYYQTRPYSDDAPIPEGWQVVKVWDPDTHDTDKFIAQPTKTKSLEIRENELARDAEKRNLEIDYLDKKIKGTTADQIRLAEGNKIRENSARNATIAKVNANYEKAIKSVSDQTPDMMRAVALIEKAKAGELDWAVVGSSLGAIYTRMDNKGNATEMEFRRGSLSQQDLETMVKDKWKSWFPEKGPPGETPEQMRERQTRQYQNVEKMFGVIETGMRLKSESAMKYANEELTREWRNMVANGFAPITPGVDWKPRDVLEPFNKFKESMVKQRQAQEAERTFPAPPSKTTAVQPSSSVAPSPSPSTSPAPGKKTVRDLVEQENGMPVFNAGAVRDKIKDSAIEAGSSIKSGANKLLDWVTGAATGKVKDPVKQMDIKEKPKEESSPSKKILPNNVKDSKPTSGILPNSKPADKKADSKDDLAQELKDTEEFLAENEKITFEQFKKDGIKQFGKQYNPAGNKGKKLKRYFDDTDIQSSWKDLQDDIKDGKARVAELKAKLKSSGGK